MSVPYYKYFLRKVQYISTNLTLIRQGCSEPLNSYNLSATLTNGLYILRSRNRALVKMLSCCTITLGHTRLDHQHISCRSSAGRCLIIHCTARISRPVISIFSYTSRNSCPVSVSVFRMIERRRWVSHSSSNPRRQPSTTQDTEDGPTVWHMSQFRSWICWKIAQHVLCMFPHHLSLTSPLQVHLRDPRRPGLTEPRPVGGGN